MWMVYAGISDRMPLHQEKTSNQHAVSKVLGGSYCNRNADSETEADRKKLIYTRR